MAEVKTRLHEARLQGTTSEAKTIIIGSPVNSDRDNKYLNPGELYCQNNKVTIEKGQPWCRVQKNKNKSRTGKVITFPPDNK